MEYKLETVTKSYEKYRNLRFPLKIWILLNARGNRFLRWNRTKTLIELDREGTEAFLQRLDSIFRCKQLTTFFWLLDFYGFEPVTENESKMDEDKNLLLYKHVSFNGENRAYFEQLLRSPRQREVIDQEQGGCSMHQARIVRNHKEMETGCSVEATRSQLSSNSFAQDKFNFLMETKSLELSIREAYANMAVGEDGVVPIIEVPGVYCDEPSADIPGYTKERKIAGNYGQVNLEDLKRFFGNYLPVYDDSVEAQNARDPEEPEQVDKSDDEFEFKADSPKIASPAKSVSPKSSPSPPPQVFNTLDTFNYNEETSSASGMATENLEPILNFEVSNTIVPGGEPGEMELSFSINLPIPRAAATAAAVEEEQPEPSTVIDDDSKCSELFNPAQFQLCADIRETFDLLNEF
ncbi:uncharacterized protein LOC129752012 [Uranotaenia lowii]|uniref:uncharacterized protein LOC129752012 n=1 Tax=Uranotaenia lowii TaxID=190385 RepID=UPI00247A717C|nr:uncharacterized protein LOC129752012 [Uranotaenia lowii]